MSALFPVRRNARSALNKPNGHFQKDEMLMTYRVHELKLRHFLERLLAHEIGETAVPHENLVRKPVPRALHNKPVCLGSCRTLPGVGAFQAQGRLGLELRELVAENWQREVKVPVPRSSDCAGKCT